jgi:hypothetical protein
LEKVILLKTPTLAELQWLILVLLVTLEAEIGRMEAKASPGK